MQDLYTMSYKKELHEKVESYKDNLVSENDVLRMYSDMSEDERSDRASSPSGYHLLQSVHDNVAGISLPIPFCEDAKDKIGSALQPHDNSTNTDTAVKIVSDTIGFEETETAHSELELFENNSECIERENKIDFSHQKAIPQNVKEGITKVANWLDDKPGHIEDIHTIQTLFNSGEFKFAGDNGNNVTISDVQSLSKTYDLPENNLKEIEKKPNIQLSEHSNCDIPHPSKKSKRKLKNQQSLLCKEESVDLPEEHQGIGKRTKFSRRFKYGNLSVLNSKKAIVEKHILDNSTLSGIKVSENSTNKTNKQMNDDILALMSFKNENIKTESDNTTSSHIQPSSAMDVTSDPAHNLSHLFQIPNSPFGKGKQKKIDQNFIDFQIEPSNYFPQGRMETKLLDPLIGESTVKTYDSSEVSEDLLFRNNKTGNDDQQCSMFFTKADGSCSAMMSPVFKAESTQMLPSEPIVSPLREMLFLIPKDTYDVVESHGESDAGTPCQLPELPNIKLQKSHNKTKNICTKVNVEKYTNLTQLEETQVIENELQDLLSTLPTKANSPITSHSMWKDKLFSYDLCCNFTDCQQKFLDPSTLIEHMRNCIDSCNNSRTTWKLIADNLVVCPECLKSVTINSYDKHYQEKHNLLLNMLKELGKGNNVKCKNYKCKTVMDSVLDCVHHFRKCGGSGKSKKSIECDLCGRVFKTKKGCKNHICEYNKKYSENMDSQKKPRIDRNLHLYPLAVSKGNVDVTSKVLNDMNNENIIEHCDRMIISGETSNEITSGTPITAVSSLHEFCIGGKFNSILPNITNENMKDFENVSGTADHLNSKETAGNLEKLQEICNNILMKSDNSLIKSDTRPDKNQDILLTNLDILLKDKNLTKSQFNKNSNNYPNTHTKINTGVRKRSHKKSSISVKSSDVNEETVATTVPSKGPSQKRRKVKSKSDNFSISKHSPEKYLSTDSSEQCNDNSKIIDTPKNTFKSKKLNASKLDTIITKMGDNFNEIHVGMDKSNSNIPKKSEISHIISEPIGGFETTLLSGCASRKKTKDKHKVDIVLKESEDNKDTETPVSVYKVPSDSAGKNITKKNYLKNRSQTKRKKCDSPNIDQSLTSKENIVPATYFSNEETICNSSVESNLSAKYAISEVNQHASNHFSNIGKEIVGSHASSLPGTNISTKINDEIRKVDEDDLSSLSVWLSSVMKYTFYCPRDDCLETFYRLNSLVAHMRRCVKRSTYYLNAKMSCPECTFTTTVKMFTDHFGRKHLLLHWYMGQLEKGNWAICQNYKCSKYMDDIEECAQHYHTCDYLWKCKYCEIEYTKESSVKIHHCQTSDDESNNEDNINEDELNANGSENASIDKIKAHIIKNIDMENVILDIHEIKENIIHLDDNTEINKKLGEKKCNIQSIIGDKDTHLDTKCRPTKITKVNKMKNMEEKVTKARSKTVKPSEEKGKEIEEITANLKDNINRHEDALKQWQESFKLFQFNCPVKICVYTSHLPVSLLSHIRSCKFVDDKEQFKTMSQIESMKFNCPFDFCKKNSLYLPMDDYAKHMQTNHRMVLTYVKAICTEGKTTCLNYKCAKEITRLTEAVTHYNLCKYLWQCQQCQVEYRNEMSVKNHKCSTKVSIASKDIRKAV